MSSAFSSALASIFSAPTANPVLDLIKNLKAIHPSSQHVSTLQQFGMSFPLSAYLSSINISTTIVEPDTHSVTSYDHGEGTVYTRALAGVTSFTYEGTTFEVFKVSWTQDQCIREFYDFVFTAKDDSLGQKLVAAVYKWAHSLKEEMWIFEAAHWSKNKHLYKAVQAANWDDIVLDTKFKDGLKRDTETFFSSKEVYRSLGITWKRGILLLGPPGNGKTESIKALLKEAECAVLYAKSFVTRQGPEEGVRAIFQHARDHSPCILVLEDLDAMVTDEVRSFFLNELDGLAQNDGILTIATTNHPERIDDAILNRPSRFDVKYTFTLPDEELRKAFALKWIDKIYAMGPNTGILFEDPHETASAVSEKTNGWSFAFLKELFVSFLLRVAHDKSMRERGADVPTQASGVLLLQQVDQLAAQIVKSKDDANEAQGTAKMAHPSMFRGVTMMQRSFPMTLGGTPIQTAGINF